MSTVSDHMKRLRSITYSALLVGLLPCLVNAQAKPEEQPADTVDARLAKIKRLCIQSFGADALGVQVQEMVIAKLFQSKKISLTENCEKADYVLKGSITESREYASRSESEGINFGARTAARDSSTAVSTGATGGAHESLSSSEVKQQAAVTMRITDKDGEILWATSQESAEGKSKSAIGLAADQAVRRLLRDMEKAQKQTQASSSVK